MKIAVFLPNWIGDAVMATPALRAVRRRFSDASITAVMRPYVADVLQGLDLIDHRLLDYSRSRSDVRARGAETIRVIRRLKRERFDLALLLPNSFRTGLIAFCSRAKRRVGFAGDGRRWLLTDRVTPRPKTEPHPVLDEYLRLTQRLGCRDLSRQMELATVAADEQRLRSFRQCHGEALFHSGFVCLNPGGAFGAAKHWPIESFAELARRIVVEWKKTVVVLCGPAERNEADRIVQLANNSRVLSLGQYSGDSDWPLTIGLTKAAVKHSQLLITTDSGPRHFAAPFDVPVITLFGPTHIAWSETYYSKAIHLQMDVDCGPCQQRVCPEGHHHCMRQLTVKRVLTQAASLLKHEKIQAPLPAA